MTTQLIPVFAGEISGVSVQLCEARLLHEFLEVAARFNDWIARRIEEYSFIDGQDFYSILSKTKGRPSNDYHLTLDMAKELAMVERTEKGKEARRYFIEMERMALLQLTNNPLQFPEHKTKKALPGCLRLDQQDTIKALVKERAESLPKDKQAGAAIRIWSSVKAKFGVSYKEIPEGEYINVVSLIGRLPLPGELLPKQAPAEDQITPEVQAVIDRRAMANVFKHYERYKQQIHDAIKQRPAHDSRPLIEYVQSLDTKDTSVVMINRDDLWRLTSLQAVLQKTTEHSLAAIHQLEESTGMEWYGR